MDTFGTVPWGLLAIVLVTFMVTHVIGYRPGKNPRGNFLLRVLSSFILLAALLMINLLPAAIALAAVAGFVSGRAAPALKPRPTQETRESEVTSSEGDSA